MSVAEASTTSKDTMGSMAKGASEANILGTILAVGASGLAMRVGLQNFHWKIA